MTSIANSESTWSRVIKWDKQKIDKHWLLVQGESDGIRERVILISQRKRWFGVVREGPMLHLPQNLSPNHYKNNENNTEEEEEEIPVNNKFRNDSLIYKR